MQRNLLTKESSASETITTRRIKKLTASSYLLINKNLIYV